LRGELSETWPDTHGGADLDFWAMMPSMALRLINVGRGLLLLWLGDVFRCILSDMQDSCAPSFV
jgi:hypothetical protein